MNGKGNMTSRDRVYAAMDLKEPDRVPLFVSTRLFGIYYSGYTLGDCYTDADKYVDSQVCLLSDFAHDAVWDLAGVHPIERALGQKMLDARDDVPSPLDPLLKEPDDLRKFPKKLQLEGRGWTDHLVSINRKLRERVGKDIPVVGNVNSPFLSACSLRGTQYLYMDMYERPNFVKDLVEYLIEPVLDYSRLLTEAGADIIYTACPVASRTMISRKHYEEFVHPVHKRIFDYWKNKLGRRILFHNCGDWSDRFDLVVDEGPHIIHVDKIDLARLKKEFGSRVCINGNVGSTTTLMIGTPEEVRKEAIDCIKKAGVGGGFMLGADCVVPKTAPAQNMKALTEAAFEAGNYPIQI